jgi:4-amino-4-deoxy-L-arabinose transferase-like glycosyltransferase
MSASTEAEPTFSSRLVLLLTRGPQSNLRATALLALLTILCLAPFLDRPFHIDEPLFLWKARQILAHPLDPYGFQVNWYYTDKPMWDVTKNPPLAAYYLAAAAALLGWSEVALHSAFLLPACAVVIGVFFLAKPMCRLPMLAALAALFTPAFLASSATVMCDTLMLAFWVWAVVLWRRGLERHDASALASASLLVAAAALTKYFGACLIPLLAVYAWLHQRKAGRWLVCLLIPLLILAAYEVATRKLYGRGLGAEAGAYVTGRRSWADLPPQFLIGLAFTGGCAGIVLFFLPLMWTVRRWLPLALFSALPLGWMFLKVSWHRYTPPVHALSPAWTATQWVIMAAGGVAVLALALADLRSRRDAEAWLLFLWTVGTFLFTSLVNWTANGRSVLPMIPSLAILLARRLEQNGGAIITAKPWRLFAPLALSAALAFAVTQADYAAARSVKDAARMVHEKATRLLTETGKGQQRLWFSGHWGFQYYMELAGARIIDLDHLQLRVGDLLAVPGNNSNVLAPEKGVADPVATLTMASHPFLATHHYSMGAGFHSSAIGSLPFAFGKAPPVEYRLLRIVVEP